ncbi:MAG: selenium metabolism-associated LysR family transcriptional regulator [Bacillota bacterium]
MKLNTLKIFVNLIDLGSYSLTADKLNLTQPAVSMQIKSLEEKFDEKLVLKEKGELKLTPVGKIIYSESKKILKNWDSLLQKVEMNKGKKAKELYIASSTIPSEYMIPDILACLLNYIPELKARVTVGDSAESIDLLERNKVDLAVVGYKPENNKFKIIEAADDRLKLILPSEHKLALKDKIFLEDLQSEKMLIREEGSGTRKAMLAGFNKLSLTLNDFNIVGQLGSTESIISAVQSGLGISFVSQLASSKAAGCRPLVEIDVADMQSGRKFYLAFSKNRENDPIIKRFIDCL